MKQTILLAAIASLLPGQAANSAEPFAWRAGTAKTVITPEQPFWLAGFAVRTKPADGKLHDLWVKVLALEDAQRQKAVVIASDLLGFPKPLADSICRQIETKCGLQRSQIMLTCSHTHSGPVLVDALPDVYPLDANQRALRDQYTRRLEQMVVETVAKAIDNLAPATLAAGTGTCDFAVNRRVLKDGKWVENGAFREGPSDFSLPVLTVRAADGNLKAVLFTYACHNSTLNICQYSGDYAGFAQIAVETKHPAAMAMFAMGCGADQNALPRGTVEQSQNYGNRLAASVEAVLTKKMRRVESTLHTDFEIIDLPFDGEPSVEYLHAEAAKEVFIARWANRVIREMSDLKAQGKHLPKSSPYPIQVWRLGADQLWIALGGEPVVDYSLSLKAKYGPNTWVFGYANAVMAYIPSHRVWNEGGYEAGAFAAYGVAAQRWSPDIEDRIKAAVDRLVSQSQPAAAPAKAGVQK